MGEETGLEHLEQVLLPVLRAFPLLWGSLTSPALSSFPTLVLAWELRVDQGPALRCLSASVSLLRRQREGWVFFLHQNRLRSVCVSSLLIHTDVFLHYHS